MAQVHTLKGKEKEKIELPEVFETPYRPDLIQRAVVTLQSQKRQPYGTDPKAGYRTTADYFGKRRGAFRQTINRGISRLPRTKTGGGGIGEVKKVPQSVGGRRAHPPRNKDYSRKMNKKEYQLALKSAIASTTSLELAKERGHRVEEAEMPLIVDNSLEKITKAKELIDVLKTLGLEKDLERARKKKKKAGTGKNRGRPARYRISALIVVGKDQGIKNITSVPGVDIVTFDELDVEMLAPGTHPGRVTIWTRSALEKLEEIE